MTSKMNVIDKAITTNLRALGDHTLHEVDKKMDVLEEKMNLSLNLAAETRDEAKVNPTGSQIVFFVLILMILLADYTPKAAP